MVPRKIEKAPSTLRNGDKQRRNRLAVITRLCGSLIVQYSGIRILSQGGMKLFRRIRERINTRLKSLGKEVEDLRDPSFADEIVRESVNREM